MILPGKNFRSHVPRCTTSLMAIFSLPVPSNTKVCDPAVALMVKNNVFWLDITMDDAIFVKVAETFHDASNYEF